MSRFILLTTLLLMAVVGVPSTASAAQARHHLVDPTLDLDWRFSATADDGGSGQEADALRRQKLGRLEVGIGAGLAVGGVLAITFVGIDATVTNNYCSAFQQNGGYSYCWYEDSAQFPAGVISAVLGGLMIAGGTVLIVGGVLRLVRLQKARDASQQARRHWGWRWGPPTVSGAAPPSPAALSRW